MNSVPGMASDGCDPTLRAHSVTSAISQLAKPVDVPFNRRKPRGSMQIFVRENNIDGAIRVLKKKLRREGVFREMKLRRHHEKPS